MDLSVQARPQRPRFSWDARGFPWSDVIGDQLEYGEDVSPWSTFYETLPDGNRNKIDKRNRGIVIM